MINQNPFLKLKEKILYEKKIISEINSLLKNIEKKDIHEKEIINSQIVLLKDSLKRTNEELPAILEKIALTKPLNAQVQNKPDINPEESNIPVRKTKKLGVKGPRFFSFLEGKKIGNKKLTILEKETLRRIKKKKLKKPKKKLKKPSKYVQAANKIFFNFSSSISDKEIFRTLKKDLIKANLQFVPANYLSTILFTTLLSLFFAIFIFIFFLFFNFGVQLPIITRATESIVSRLIKVFWIIFAIPLAIFLIGYFYPSMERKSLENKINQELPFATIHMFAISGSLMDPSRIFSVIIATKEYKSVETQFKRLINEINVYGYDLVSALRSTALRSPSKKLAELFNGFATTITSGGNIRDFFDKRSQSLLFDYRLEREKYTKSAETFMDIYISVVIAAPMILMLLMILIKISGLGIALSTSAITLIMVLSVSMINVLFLTFLYLKQPSG